jgi:sporulation protein YlmC with PRC-barrel domain
MRPVCLCAGLGAALLIAVSAGAAPRRAAPAGPAPPVPAAEAMLGRSLVTVGGRHLGQIVDVLVDRRSGQVRSVVVARRHAFGQGGHAVEVDGADLRWAGGRKVVADIAPDEFNSLPRWSPAEADQDEVGLRDR